MTIEPWGGETPEPHHPAHRDTDSWVPILPAVADLAEKICQTEFVPASLRGSVPKTAAAILYSREMGLPPMTGLGSVHVIQGRAGMYAETMRAMIQAAGHEIRVTEMTETRCVIKGRRRGEEEWATASYTMAEAVKAGDAKKNPNYQTRPADMLLARASGRLAKMAFADVIKGLAVAEEIEYDREPGAEVVHAPTRSTTVDEPAEPAPSATVGRRRAASSRAPRPEPQQPRERARVTRPAPKSTPKAEASQETVETLPEEPEPDEDGVIEVLDAEVVEDEPTKPSDEDRDSKSFRGATTAAVMHFDRLEIKDRAERIWYTSELIGKQVTSTNDLSLAELRGLVSVLEKCKDIDAVNRVLDAKRQGGES